MNALFSPDSTLMRGLTAFADVMILNFLFIVTALPVVTLGASLTALNFTAMRIATGQCSSVSGDYFRSFSQNFRQGTMLGLLLALFSIVLAAWYAVISGPTFEPGIQFGLLLVWYVITYSFVAMALFAFPYLARFEGSTWQVLRNARLMSWKHPPVGLAALALPVLAGAVTVFYPAATGFGLFWLIFGFAGVATINGRLFAMIFDRYIAAAAASPKLQS